MRTLRLAALLATASLLLTPALAQARTADHADTQAVLNAYQAKAGPGAGVYAGNRTTSWQLSSGTATINTREDIRAEQVFRAASQTKAFVAAVILQLVDEGKVVLDAPVERYLPGVVRGNGYDGNRITVRQLLQHTAGIARDATNPQAAPGGGYELRELVRAGLANKPVFEPGTGWQYSNVGYFIAGLLVEQVTGTPIREAVTARIIQPLGLTSTKYPAAGDRSLGPNQLRGYLGGRLGPLFFWYEATQNMDPTQVHSAGALASSLVDLAAFHQAIADGRVFSRAMLAEMRTTVPIPGGSNATDGDGYGLGVVRYRMSCGGEAWGHAGDLTTGHSSVTLATDDGRRASVVSNAYVAGGHTPTRFQVADSALCGSR
ncbi:D-alanyl-D-alanine carboxypeptidase [Crossiella equi]|uniref:D-alanyl-D-alanine carboxypeptidase n=1 Tax=Crossiella equi TaxID=130796 RepID=A0ABS5ARQ6_9PSEU|nr:serine hydrolase domain-containing protein [Crossiella equi]MBP2478922.1 D-alanyl-D-alanine carboxypeptidase [Crossiella equi]